MTEKEINEKIEQETKCHNQRLAEYNQQLTALKSRLETLNELIVAENTTHSRVMLELTNGVADTIEPNEGNVAQIISNGLISQFPNVQVDCKGKTLGGAFVCYITFGKEE